MFTVKFKRVGFKPPVTEGYKSFYLINKCTKNVELQYIYQEELVHVTYDTSVYTTKWLVIGKLYLVLNVTIIELIYSFLFPSVQTILLKRSVSGSGRMTNNL
jgi:hypothetical protein